MLRLSNIQIGAKLAIMSGIAVLLVVGMAINQQMSGSSVAALTAKAGQSIAVRRAVLGAQIAILRTWVARRNILLAESVPEADAALKVMLDNTAAGQGLLDHGSELSSTAEDRERLQQLKVVFTEYIASSEAQAAAHKDLLNLRKRQIDTTPAWNKALSAVTSSPESNNPAIQSDLRDGISSMKDARIAYWRYSTLLDDEYTGIMHAAADKAIASLNHAKGLATDAGLKAGLDALLTVMGELNDIMSAAKKSVDFKNQQEHDRTGPARAKLDEIIPKAEESADKAAQAEQVAAAAEMSQSGHIGLGAAVFVVLVLIGSAMFGSFSIARPLRKMAGVLGELTNDRIVEVPYTERGDEIGKIAKATEVFKDSIAGKVINLRIRTALDVVRSNVMLSDNNYNIIYMNGTLQQTLREAETEIRKAMPNFESGKLMGMSMDVFHKNPSHQRKLLDSLTGSHEAHIVIGSQKFMLVATPVRDKDGKRNGTVLEWKNETVEMAIEEEVDGIVKAAIDGDFSRRVALEGKSGFMLNLSTAMNGLCGNVAETMADFAELLGAMADGDLVRRITADYHGVFGKLKDDANRMANRLTETLADIKSVGREVANAAAEISTSTTDLSQRTEEQAASLEQTSASMEEMSATVKNNA
jgi:HAMP domain